MTADRLSSLVSCFKDKFGDGPYAFDGMHHLLRPHRSPLLRPSTGLTIPDAGNQGNEMGVADASGNFFVGIGNLCGCSQQIDGNIFEILMGAADGSVTSARTGCAGDQCSAVTGADGTQLPSGVYASFYACPAADYGECGGAGVNQFETCDVDLS